MDKVKGVSQGILNSGGFYASSTLLGCPPSADVVERKTFTVEELKTLPLRAWVWIEVLVPFDYEEKVSAYYRKQEDYTHDKAFCCGYPGLSFVFYYEDYGKTWIAYQYQPDVAPVVHGRWLFGELDVLGQPVHCSVCGWGQDKVNKAMWLEYPAHKYCGCCGAKMDQE